MKINVVTTFSGYDSQCLALDQLKKTHPDFDYELLGWSEIEENAINAHNLLYPQYADRNLGDITKIDWNMLKGNQVDLFTYSSPCITADSLILTKTGYKQMKDVCVGDEVLTKSNTWHKVAKKFDNGIHQTCYLNGYGFENIHCTLNHKFYVRKMYRKGHKSIRTFADPEFVEVKDLDKSYYFGLPVVDSNEMPHWDGVIDNRWGHGKIQNNLSKLFHLDSFWYIMGRYVGDGWKRESDSGCSVIICCGGRHEEELTYAMDECGFHYSVEKGRTSNKYHIHSNELFAFVERYGYMAYGKKIDGETMLLPTELLESFVNGLFDSDGCKINHYYKYTSVSRELVYGIQYCIARVYKRPISLYKTKRPSTCVIEGRTVNQRDFYNLVFKKVDGIQDKAFYEDGYIWYPFKGYTLAEEENVYNMEIEEDHSYIIQGCISKNCQDISQAGKQMGLKEGSETRSSLLWNVIDAIKVLRPKYLMQENVKALVSKKFLPDFAKWCERLEQYGYKNYWAVLNAKDFGVPQNRERVFMISIRDDIGTHYQFPKGFELKTVLADVLEDDVDEKYYLSDESVEKFMMTSEEFKNKHNFADDGCAPEVTPNEESNFASNGLPMEITAPSGKVYHYTPTEDGRPMWTRTEVDENGVTHKYGLKFRIRKLTPRECFRLMGVRDYDIDKLLTTEIVPVKKGSIETKEQQIISNSQLYKCAGNSIVVDVMVNIFENLLYPTYDTKSEVMKDDVGQGILEFEF